MRDHGNNDNANRANMEAKLQEIIHILRSIEFDEEAFKTILKGHAGRSRQRFETA